MNPIFELPELLNLNGDAFSTMIGWDAAGSGCSTGCKDGCNSGCDGGAGDGKKPGIAPPVG